MTATGPIGDDDLHGFIDGELPAWRAELVAAALERDPAWAARAAAFRRDKAALASAYGGIAAAPLPSAWTDRITRATAQPAAPRRLPRNAAWVLALAACIALALGAVALRRATVPGADTILEQAQAARQEHAAPIGRLAGAALADRAVRNALITRAVGLKLQVPDLIHLGWRLAEIDTYTSSAALRYRAADGQMLTLFVRRSAGTPRFDLWKAGSLRTCIWQDEVLGVVLMGDMSAGQMMRAAAAAYVSLSS